MYDFIYKCKVRCARAAKNLQQSRIDANIVCIIFPFRIVCFSILLLLLSLLSLKVMMQILKDMGVTEYEPRVINQMLEFTYSKSGCL